MMEITQEDREAAWLTRPEAFHDELCKPAWFAGVYDKSRHIQSYAAHRIASEQAVLAKLRPHFFEALRQAWFAGRASSRRREYDSEAVEVGWNKLIDRAIADALEGKQP